MARPRTATSKRGDSFLVNAFANILAALMSALGLRWIADDVKDYSSSDFTSLIFTSKPCGSPEAYFPTVTRGTH